MGLFLMKSQGDSFPNRDGKAALTGDRVPGPWYCKLRCTSRFVHALDRIGAVSLPSLVE